MTMSHFLKSCCVGFLIVSGGLATCLAETPEAKEEKKAKVVKLPAFEKILKSEKCFNKQALPVGHTYGYYTNKSLEELKPLILKDLGEGWSMKISMKNEVKKFSEGTGMKFVGVGELKHDDFSGYSIGVTLIDISEIKTKNKIEYRRMLSIVTVDLAKAAAIEKEKKKAEEERKKSKPEKTPEKSSKD